MGEYVYVPLEERISKIVREAPENLKEYLAEVWSVAYLAGDVDSYHGHVTKTTNPFKD